jgi:EAL domain-containing protein (putative c-di-GMP-specific phosphodiesterase class I)
MINEMHVNPENIIIEITESVFSSNYEDINKILGELRNSGIKIAIDDFGTGYSSLAREQELNVDCLKIDKYFIDKLLELHPDNAITAEVISMAHKMGHWVIAEGVEHEIQKEYLVNNGCDSFQGYLFARPLDENTALEMIKKQ